ncbi:urease accessory protein UreD [Clostridium sp. SHJSY1]|uniref:urease accessory protein UreD n=1 Tax=Clostridium sp. SHJSY1 TaxID=2942483 RepID=UPI0028770AEE|nr:urease accessory protein UreD [Clostridium sp. SHJSY1]MDS0527455.1 urease accessory protein UreD [Clostridium sp. SHJSY1]
MSVNKFGKTSKVVLEVARKDNANYLKDVYFTAPFKIMKPFIKPDGGLKVMILTASAGIMEGDTQEIEIKVNRESSLEYTSQAYEKIHKMKAGEAIRKTTIIVEEKAEMKYRPLPTIPFADSAFRSETNIYLKDETSKFSMIEILTSGRVATGESFKYRYYISKTSIRIGEKLIYRDNSVFNPEIFGLKDIGMFEGYTHLGNLILCNYNIGDEKIKNIREYIDNEADICVGATRFSKYGISIKILGSQSQKILELCNYIIANYIEREPI